MRKLIILIFLCNFTNISLSQNNENTSAKYSQWALIQLVPSPVFFHDGDGINNRVQFGLRWNITPLSISFKSNKFISSVQFFMINPVRRFTGSFEIFVQPEWTTAAFHYAELNRFGVSGGGRFIIPLKGGGETFAFSLGGKVNYRKDKIAEKNFSEGIEAGLYVIYGILGVQFTYNFNSRSKYNAGFYFKYF